MQVQLPKKFLAKRAKGRYKETYHALHMPGIVPGYSWLVINANTGSIEAEYTSAHQASIAAENMNKELRQSNPSKRKITAARRAQLIKQLEKARAARKRKTPKKRTAPKRRKRAKNPVTRRTVKHTPMFKLVVQKGSGPRMHYNGAKFTTNGHYVKFSTQNELLGVSRELMRRFPILKGYKFIGVPVGSK
jgi:hypothetical protein